MTHYIYVSPQPEILRLSVSICFVAADSPAAIHKARVFRRERESLLPGDDTIKCEEFGFG